jgi:predicted RND superfamily exporter protein
MDGYRDRAVLFLGGVPMITSDSIAFIRSDLKVFGVGVVLFIVLILAVSFRHSRWVVLPLGVCLVSAGTMVGYLGWMQWPVTVVSSNFISLLLIITLSLMIHLIVRYRELASIMPEADQFELVRGTVYSKFTPSLFTAITTIVAFGSLLVSGIRPVIDFGWMMVIGIVVSFILAFILFPAALMLLPRLNTPVTKDMTGAVTMGLANFIQHRMRAALMLFTALVVIGLTGIPKLSVDNRFIDYYKDDTEIYQGMSLIDNKLGGTTPLDVIIDAPADEVIEVEDLSEIIDITANSYWFNRDGLREVSRIHQYLDQLPETGKVLSVHTAMKMLESLNNDKPYNDFKLAVVYKRLPDDVKDTLISPYLSKDGNQLRFSIRLYESSKSLRRQELLDKIYYDLIDNFNLDPEQVTISGVAVLFNNLLQSLFKSQILTLGAVFVAILMMFILLFGSVRLAVAAIRLNGLDRYPAGYHDDNDRGHRDRYRGGRFDPLRAPISRRVSAGSQSLGRYQTLSQQHCARNVLHLGNRGAVYYTSVTVVLGFSILVLSNFIPTIYFGLLSGLAMMTALLANLVLLPILIARFRLS